ncbi:MAG: hypothetical protein K8R35_01520 [Bacteroidales bacterium]|nr:hypothetical protein [Bacteroidales bacterium]
MKTVVLPLLILIVLNVNGQQQIQIVCNGSKLENLITKSVSLYYDTNYQIVSRFRDNIIKGPMVYVVRIIALEDEFSECYFSITGISCDCRLDSLNDYLGYYTDKRENIIVIVSDKDNIVSIIMSNMKLIYSKPE